MKWLATLVWPEQHDRVGRLNSAIDVARVCDPGVIRGDLRTDLAALAARAPSNATLVVFHTAVLGYVASQEDRDAFAKTCSDVGATWISNEWPNVFPAVTARVVDVPQGKFLISVNGQPVAWTPPHGQALDWIAGS